MAKSYRISEAAKIVGVSRQRIDKLAAKGVLKIVSGRYEVKRISEKSLLVWLEATENHTIRS